MNINVSKLDLYLFCVVFVESMLIRYQVENNFI